MEDTDWEKQIDKMVDQNLKVHYDVYDSENGLQYLDSSAPPLVENHDYVVRVKVTNEGTEVLFSRVQLKVIAKSNVTFYTRKNYYHPTGISYGSPISRIHVTKNNLLPQGTEDWWIPFRVSGTIQNNPLISVGLYATVVPEGHHWMSFNWPDDRFTGK